MQVPSSNSSPIERMVAMNNYGVQLLGEGNLFFARQAFYRATDFMHEVLDFQEQSLAQLRQKVNNGNSNSTNNQRDSCLLSLRELEPSRIQSGYSPESVPSQTSCPTTSAPPTATVPSAEATHVPKIQDDSLYSFLRPVLFSQDDFARAQNPPLMQISVCILFNLAVANHTIALSNIDSTNNTQQIGPSFRHSALEEAIHLYQLAYGLQVDAGVEVSWLHTLGMINNVGQLHIHAKQTRQAQECFENLLQLLLLEQTRRHLDGYNRPEDGYGTYLELFLDNVFRVNHPQASAAA